MKSARTNTWIVATADFALAYLYAFVANALPFERSGPAAPPTYWVTQLWVYAFIAPMACVATWRGVRQFQRLQRGHEPWWRLPAEAAALGAAPLVFIAAFEHVPVFRAILEGAAVAAGLGLVVAAANTLGSRVLASDDSDHSASISRSAV